ncbi:MAG: GntR family transcriptional regulator [Culicoidibacterales bacterium]
MNIDKKSRVPLYVQLIDILIEQITVKEFKEGDKLPFENEMCIKYNVSRTTVRQALSELEKDGYIEVIHGKGTYVKQQRYKQSFGIRHSFDEEMKRIGLVPKTEVISFKLIKATKAIATMLQTEAEVYEIIRLRFVDGTEKLYETTYLASELVGGLTKADLEKNGLYKTLNEKYNLKISDATDTFRAVEMNAVVAAHLKRKEGSAALQIERIGYCNQIPLEYTIEIAADSEFAYTIEVSIKI